MCTMEKHLPFFRCSSFNEDHQELLSANSGAGKCTRHMWNSGKNILWTHLSKIFFDELAVGGCKVSFHF